MTPNLNFPPWKNRPSGNRPSRVDPDDRRQELTPTTPTKDAETAQAEGVGKATKNAVEQTINPIGLTSEEMGQLHRDVYQGFWDILTEGAYTDETKDQWNTLRNQ